MTPQERTIALELLKLFKIGDTTADQVLTEGQLEIFCAMVFRRHKRVDINCSTQYGKSLTVALACLVITCIQHKVVVIVAPKDDKAKIIMRYYIEHLGDHAVFYKSLEKNTKLERLRMEESKDRIMLNDGGGIFVLSAQASNANKGFEAAMGEGAEIVIMDEAALIPDQIEATIFRMIAGKGEDAFYCKIGNPFYRNHFFQSSLDPNYHHIFIDYQQGLKEGRYTQEFIDEAKRKPFFDILFACTFPRDDIMDIKGYTRLFPDELIVSRQRELDTFGELRMGVDVAEGGGDSNALVIRSTNYAWVVSEFQSEDTMTVPGYVIREGKQYAVFDHNWFVDPIGVGKGSYDRLTEQNYRPYGVKFSEKAEDSDQYVNVRAECYFRLYRWLHEGGCLEPDSRWDELKSIKYKVDSSGRLQLMPKEEMRRQGMRSPNIADALAMTFARKSVINVSREQRRQEKENLKMFDFYKNKNQYARYALNKTGRGNHRK